MTNQLYRPGADPSSTRSTSSAVARTAIPITHYRIPSKQQPAATRRLVANHASRVGPADACFRDCIGAAWQPLTVAPMLRPRRAMCVRRRLLPVIRTKVGKHWSSAVALALPLEAALLHLDTDFELHRLSHGPGDAAVSRPTTRRVIVARSASRPFASRANRLLQAARTGHFGREISRRANLAENQEIRAPGGRALCDTISADRSHDSVNSIQGFSAENIRKRWGYSSGELVNGLGNPVSRTSLPPSARLDSSRACPQGDSVGGSFGVAAGGGHAFRVFPAATACRISR